jgi:hypothetical protein
MAPGATLHPPSAVRRTQDRASVHRDQRLASTIVHLEGQGWLCRACVLRLAFDAIAAREAQRDAGRNRPSDSEGITTGDHPDAA